MAVVPSCQQREAHTAGQGRMHQLTRQHEVGGERGMGVSLSLTLIASMAYSTWNSLQDSVATADAELSAVRRWWDWSASVCDTEQLLGGRERITVRSASDLPSGENVLTPRSYSDRVKNILNREREQ
jgi:hypothetical protein